MGTRFSGGASIYKEELKMKRTIALLIVLIFGITLLASCGGGTAPKGKYVLTAMVDGGIVYGKEILLSIGFTDDNAYIEFKGGGKCKMVFAGEGIETSYTVSEKTITINFVDDDNLTGEIDGNKINFGYMIFEKK